MLTRRLETANDIMVWDFDDYSIAQGFNHTVLHEWMNERAGHCWIGTSNLQVIVPNYQTKDDGRGNTRSRWGFNPSRDYANQNGSDLGAWQNIPISLSGARFSRGSFDT